MTSAVDICNLALSHLGDEATVSEINPPEGSAQAEHCARFYPIARDEMLVRHAWSFATKRATLAAQITTEKPATWAYAYQRPSQCLQSISVHMPVIASALVPPSQFTGFPPLPGSPDDTATQDFVEEALSDGTLVIYCNIDAAILRYIEQITDTTKFTPLFVVGCARLLASYLAGPIIKGDTGMKVAQAHRTAFEKLDLPTAVAADAKARKQNVYRTFIPDGLKARA